MKTAGLMAAVLVAMTATMRPEDAAAPVRRELQKEYRYEPKPEAAPKTEALAVTEPTVEKLAPVGVTAPGRSRDLESDLRLQAQAIKDRRFALLNGGGTILERKGRKVTTEVQLKLVSVWEGAGVRALSFSW